MQPEERKLFDFLCKSLTTDFTLRSIQSNEEQMINNMFIDHCFKRCMLNDASFCPIHWQHFVYCFYGHLLRKEDYRQCMICRSFGSVDLFSKLQSGWESLSEEKKASYRTHFSICGGCWKCKQLNRDRPIGTYISTGYNFYPNRDMHDDPRNESNLVDVPNSVFYTTENADAESHTGYLRIIPVSFENDVVECDDYKELLAQLKEDAQFQQLRRAELGAIDEKELRLRHTVAREDIQGLLLRQEAVRGTKMNDECLERISLALKEYLQTLIRSCKRERMMAGDGEAEVITDLDVLRAIRHTRFLITPSSSLL